jgi:ABC-2 type transport system permease protein
MLEYANIAIKVIVQGIVLGWKVESNWTNPFVFITYMVAKPIAAVILVGLVIIIGSGASVNSDLFLYSFIGTTFFIYPANIAIALTYLVHEDRAKYEVLKYIYVTPLSLRVYIIGRGIATAVNSTISVLISILVGLFIFNTYFGLELSIPSSIDYPVLMSGVLIGVASFILLGMILYAINLITFKLQYSLSEYTTGILFLLSGVVFPTSMLPYPLQIITDALPTKHFLNLARASILNIGNYMDDLILLALTTLAILFIAVILMYIIERKARIKGTIDRKAEY